MKLTVNGNELSFDGDANVGALLGSLGLSDKRVAVELNRVILPRDAYQTTALNVGDALEIVSFVGGG